MSDQLVEVDEFQRGNVCRGQVDRRRRTRLKSFFPAFDAQTPPVARLQAGESVLRQRTDQVIASITAEFQEFHRHDRANDMDPGILPARVAATGAIETGKGFGRAGDQRLAQNVSCLRHTVTKIGTVRGKSIPRTVQYRATQLFLLRCAPPESRGLQQRICHVHIERGLQPCRQLQPECIDIGRRRRSLNWLG